MRDRSIQRGAPLLPRCTEGRPRLSYHEYGPDDDRIYCYGLCEADPDTPNRECLECGAYALNAKPDEKGGGR